MMSERGGPDVPTIVDALEAASRCPEGLHTYPPHPAVPLPRAEWVDMECLYCGECEGYIAGGSAAVRLRSGETLSRATIWWLNVSDWWSDYLTHKFATVRWRRSWLLGWWRRSRLVGWR